jgi:lysozyme
MTFNQTDAIKELADVLLEFEGESLRPYRCSAGIPTIGVGATTYPDGRKVTMKDAPITQEQSREMLLEECGKYLRSVQKMLTWEATQNQLVAMCSLSYNIGVEAFRKSTVLRTHNEGNFSAAARAFGLWNKAKVNGKLQDVRGLTSRRATEAALYLRPDPSPFKEAPVQAVSHESSLAKSPINVTGVSGVLAGGATLTTQLFAESMPVVEQVKTVATSLNINPLMVLGIVILVGGAVSIYYRYKQRIGGWA